MPVLVILFVVVLILTWFSPSRFRSTDDLMVNELIEVELNGCRQWISVRGADLKNPVLLFLHGGPGSANIAKLRIQCQKLEEHFIVVNWDQRGAGKSYWSWLRGENPSYAVLRKDAHSLVNYLRNRYNRQKIYLLGFSWGTVLGLHTVHESPEDFAAFISVGQEVDFKRAEKLSFDYVWETAKRLQDTKAMDELSQINPAYQDEDWYRQLMTQRKWLTKYNGVYHSTNNYGHEVKMLLKAPEYSFFECIAWPLNSSNSLQHIWPELVPVNMFDEVSQIDVPVYFLVGEYDMNTPTSLTEEYFNFLQAPKGKEFIPFEFSAHDIFYDQPKELIAQLIRIKENN